MAYATGSITDANSSLALYTALASLLTTAGYTLVDTVVISTRTHKVWKSAAANNSMNLDWYLDVAYTTTGVGPLHLTPFEYFDPATDLGYRGPYNAGNTTIETTYYSRYGATGYALETNWFGAQSGVGLPTSASFAYWLSVTGDRVIGLSSLLAWSICYAGFYEPTARFSAMAGAANYPLVKSEFNDPGGVSTGSYGGITRAPKSSTLNNPWLYAGGVAPEVSSMPVREGTVTTPPPSGAPSIACRAALGSPVSGTPSFDPLPGYLRDVLFVRSVNTVVRGDTFTVGSDTYVLGSYNVGSAATVAFKAA